MSDYDFLMAPGAGLPDAPIAAVAEAAVRAELCRHMRPADEGALRVRLGLCLLAQDRQVEARAELELASQDAEPHVALRALLHLARLGSPDAEAAMAEIVDGPSLAGEHPDAVVDVAAALAATGGAERAARLLRRVLDEAPPPAPRSSDNPAHRRARAVAALHLADLLTDDPAEAATVDDLLRQAVDANDPGVTPVAALRLAGRTDEAATAGCAIEDLLRIAWRYDHPVASVIAGKRLAELYITRRQRDRALRLLGALAERYGGAVAGWSWARVATLQTDEVVDAFDATDLAHMQIADDVQLFTPRAAPAPRKTIVVGAGAAATRLLHELSPARQTVVGVLDTYVTTAVNGHPIRGRVDELPRILNEEAVDDVFLAIPTATSELRRLVGIACAAHRVRLLVLPDAYELLAHRTYVHQLRRLRVEETFGEPPVLPDPTAGDAVRGRSVMIVGAGGTIGAELARQVVDARPRHLALVDQDESSLVRVQQELLLERRLQWVFPVIADAASRLEMRAAMQTHKPDVVYLAAGLNHAYLGLENLARATRVNVLGAWIPAAEAVSTGAERVVFVSCDNAPRRAVAFDLSKALAERAVVGLDAPHSSVCAVRLANVYRTSGDVIENFERQFHHGGPLTVTGPDVTRKFLNKHEAAEWLLRITVMAEPQSVYAVNAGSRVRILDLAHRIIRLRGLEPDRDIPISFTGLRAGDKLANSLWAPDEDREPTPLAEVARIVGRRDDPPGLQAALSQLESMSDASATDVEQFLRTHVLPDAERMAT